MTQKQFELAKEIYIDLRVCEENINTDINDLLLLARPISFPKWENIAEEWSLYHFAINDGREWISVKDRLPDNLRDVEISWHKNHKSNKEKVRVSHYRIGN